jgi:hypothetical protein
MPRKYSSAEESGLEVVIVPGENQYQIVLVTKE